MKSSPNASVPRNSNSNTNASHPPLARNAQSHPIPLPDGAASWQIKRETRGRPQLIKGPDGHPYRLPLSATDQDILDNFGRGTYRLDALDALGNVLDYVTTIDIGKPDDDAADEADGFASAGARGVSDLRFALQTITQMARAQADSVRAVTEAQADWVKGLAAARSLPRNAAFYLPPPAAAAAVDDDGDDDDEGADEDGAGRNGSVPGMPPTPPNQSDWWIDLVRNVSVAAVPVIQRFVSKVVTGHGDSQGDANAKTAPPAAAPPTAATPPAAATPNPMIHLAAINAGLSEDERYFLGQVLQSERGEQMTAELLVRSIDEAIAFVVDGIAQVRAERQRARAESRARAEAEARACGPAPGGPEPPAATAAVQPEPEVASNPDAFIDGVLAVAARLDADERAAVLALVPQLAPERIEQLTAHLLAMSTDEAAAWIRDNLASLRAEVGS